MGSGWGSDVVLKNTKIPQPRSVESWPGTEILCSILIPPRALARRVYQRSREVGQQTGYLGMSTRSGESIKRCSINYERVVTALIRRYIENPWIFIVSETFRSDQKHNSLCTSVVGEPQHSPVFMTQRTPHFMCSLAPFPADVCQAAASTRPGSNPPP